MFKFLAITGKFGKDGKYDAEHGIYTDSELTKRLEHVEKEFGEIVDVIQTEQHNNYLVKYNPK